MGKDHSNNPGRQLSLVYPAEILRQVELTPNDKLVLGFDFAFYNKRGYNSYTNIEIGERLNLHVNSVSNSRKALIRNQFLQKSGRKYYLTEKSIELFKRSDQIILLPKNVYQHGQLKSGEKLLWGIYNSISRGYKEYFAKRETTSTMLGVSKETVTAYTKKLSQSGLLKKYTHDYGYCSTQTKIVTEKLF
ncbi:MAG: hypothetical protein ABGW97_09770 [Christiangramia sp.]|uniref:hypothetical protein n=1 Tax=Christiangramia sp. TaxID=1931228 RepID=UPI003241ED8B